MAKRWYVLTAALILALLGLPGGALARGGPRDGQAPHPSKHGDDDDTRGLRGFTTKTTQHSVPGMKSYRPGITPPKSGGTYEGSVESDRHQRSVSEQDEGDGAE